MSSEGKNSFSSALKISASVIAVLWVVFLLDVFLFRLPEQSLTQYGIIPRHIQGLKGVLYSPFLHGNRPHLISNTIPLFILLTILYLDSRYHPNRSIFLIWFISGIGTWLIADLFPTRRSFAVANSPHVHIGASSVIYGLVTYLISAGYWMKRWRPFLIAVLTFIFYRGIFYGIIPQDSQISWEGHLSGAIAGFLVAKFNHDMA
jgi:membrane associated rhomboid family serine protease